VTCAKQIVVNEALDERLKPMAFSWLQLQLYITIAMATVQSPIYLMVLARMDHNKKTYYEVLFGNETMFTCTGELRQATSAKMNVVSSYRTANSGFYYATTVHNM